VGEHERWWQSVAHVQQLCILHLTPIWTSYTGPCTPTQKWQTTPSTQRKQCEPLKFMEIWLCWRIYDGRILSLCLGDSLMVEIHSTTGSEQLKSKAGDAILNSMQVIHQSSPCQGSNPINFSPVPKPRSQTTSLLPHLVWWVEDGHTVDRCKHKLIFHNLSPPFQAQIPNNFSGYPVQYDE